MAESDPPASTSIYIIICSGRTAVQGTKGLPGKIMAASYCAADVCKFIESKFPVTPEDFKEVSDLQHFLMDNMGKLTKKRVEEYCAQMFALLYALEEKFPSHVEEGGSE